MFKLAIRVPLLSIVSEKPLIAVQDPQIHANDRPGREEGVVEMEAGSRDHAFN